MSRVQSLHVQRGSALCLCLNYAQKHCTDAHKDCFDVQQLLVLVLSTTTFRFGNAYCLNEQKAACYTAATNTGCKHML